MRRNWPPDSPNTAYLHGPLLSDFIQDYCAARSIFFDADILNSVFMRNGFDHTRLYSEAEIIQNIGEAATQWHLNDLATAESLETRN